MRGVLALGTAGEGILLTVSERRRVAERFGEAAPEELAVFATAARRRRPTRLPPPPTLQRSAPTTSP
jgi:dihydrodipicolinate synthase/N-acetylneuraminate lyase